MTFRKINKTSRISGAQPEIIFLNEKFPWSDPVSFLDSQMMKFLFKKGDHNVY